MTFNIDSYLFYLEENYSDIDKLFDFVVENRYKVFLDDPDLFESEWHKNARKEKKEEHIKSFKDSIYLVDKPKLTIGEVNSEDSNSMTLKDGLIYLTNPVFVFLENGYYDQKCYQGLFSRFDIAENVMFFIKNRWIKFINSGGKSSVKNQLNSELRNYRKENLENFKYIKAVIIVDSDKKDPNEIKDHAEFIEYFEEKNISVHILEKREIENYLPIEILENNPKVPLEFTEALNELNHDQLDYYDYEKGFNIDSKKKLPQLYSGISDKAFKILRFGLDSKSFRTKKEMPKQFFDSTLTKEMLLKRCLKQNQPKELESIINKINQLL